MRTMLAGIHGLIFSRYFFGLLAFTTAFAAVKLFPDVRFYGAKTAEIAIAFLVLVCVVIAVNGRTRPPNP